MPSSNLTVQSTVNRKSSLFVPTGPKGWNAARRWSSEKSTMPMPINTNGQKKSAPLLLCAQSATLRKNSWLGAVPPIDPVEIVGGQVFHQFAKRMPPFERKMLDLKRNSNSSTGSGGGGHHHWKEAQSKGIPLIVGNHQNPQRKLGRVEMADSIQKHPLLRRFWSLRNGSGKRKSSGNSLIQKVNKAWP